MSAYVVVRTQRIAPRLVLAAGRPSELTPADGGRASTVCSIEEIDVRPGVAERLADRVAAARARFAQLTFYLSSPDSWR
jgi:hypothetical protein